MSTCIFCEIVAGRIPAAPVHEDDEILAFRDLNPQAPSHILVIPKRHVGGLPELAPADRDLAGALVMAGVRVAAAEGLTPQGFRLVINSGEDGGQTVGHLHLHVLGGRGMSWPPG